MTRLARMKGRTFGYLTVTDRAKRDEIPETGRGKFAFWWCACSCGQRVMKRGDQLRGGKIKACNVEGHRWRPVNGP